MGRRLRAADEIQIQITDHPADDPEGFLLEVDLEYTEDLHNAHNAYPLSLERMVVQTKMDVRVSAQPTGRWGGANRG